MWLAFVALMLPCILTAAEPAWPEAILELERVALRDPRPGAAWVQLRNFALENRLEAPWRQRWNARVSDREGASESILLGWLDLEAGDVVAARGRFERATAIAPQSYHAWLALAELQLRQGEAAGDASAHQAVALAANDAQRIEATRLPPLIAQERGELSKAWELWRAIESEPLAAGIRFGLVPDFARAHLALGDAQAWVARLRASSSGSADDLALEAAAVLALGDSALAHRLAMKALAANPGHAPLGRLVTDAARVAGFLGEAASRMETALGEAPDDDALIEALRAFVRYGAPDHLVRVCRRHAPRLAPIATRWREMLPDMWRLGITAELREIFGAQAMAGGWELPLALAEMAILENDFDTPVESLWRVLEAEFDRDEIASLSRAQANSPASQQYLLPLRGHGIGDRLRQIQTQVARKPRVFAPSDPVATGWSVYSLCDARDLVLIYLQELTRRAGGEAPARFIARLRERTAPWPLEERWLAFSIVGNPPGSIETATQILEQRPLTDPVASLALGELTRLRLVAALAPETAARLAKLLARFPDAPVDAGGHPSIQRRWEATAQRCWQLFESGKFAEADKAFEKALQEFAAAGLGPASDDWIRFHSSTLHAVGAFEDRAQAEEAASYALRWVALQVPRRPEWPSPARAQALWRERSSLTGVLPLFFSARQPELRVYSAERYAFFPPVGGNLPADLWPALRMLTVHLDRAAGETGIMAVARQTDGLAPESARVLTTLSAVPPLFRRVAPPVTDLRKMFATPDGEVARLLVQLSDMVSRPESGSAASEDVVSAASVPGAVGHTSWQVARMRLLGLGASVEEPAALVESLLEQPLDALEYAGLRQILAQKVRERIQDAATLRALSAKLAIARQRAEQSVPGRAPVQLLPSEVAEQLRSYLDAVEIDEAVTLGQRVLDWPPARAQRDPTLRVAQKQAVTALQECGELNGWFAARQTRAKSTSVAEVERFAAQCGLIVETLPSGGVIGSVSGVRRNFPRPEKVDQLAVALRGEALAAATEAQAALIRIQPGNSRHWMKLRELRGYSGATSIPAPSFDLETMLRGASEGLEIATAVSFLGGDLDKLADLAQQWPLRPGGLDGNAGESADMAVRLGWQLWEAGRKEAATRWLEKLFAAQRNPWNNAEELRSRLLEALAGQGDRAAMARVLALALRETFQPAEELGVYPNAGSPGSPRAGRPGSAVAGRPPIRPILDQASKLGLIGEVIAALAGEDHWPGRAATLFLRIAQRDRGCLPGISAARENVSSLQFLEDLAEVLAPWPEARAEAQMVLRQLEPAYALPPGLERTRQLIRHAALAAQCGMSAEASAWLQASLDPGAYLPANDVQSGFDALLALTSLQDAAGAARMAEKISVEVRGRRFLEIESLKRLQSLAAEGRDEVVRSLVKAFQDQRSFQETTVTRAFSAFTCTRAGQTDQWESFRPMVWTQDRDEDGTTEVGWALGWSAGQGPEKILYTPDASLIHPAQPFRVELFCGQESDRLERVATEEKLASSGLLRVKLPTETGFLAISISTGGRTILGPPQPFRVTKSLLAPPADQLHAMPPALWSKSATGPAGTALRGITLDPQGDGEKSLESATLLVTPVDGKDLTITGWVKAGSVSLAVESEGSRKPASVKVIRGEPQAWIRIDHVISAQKLVEMRLGQGPDARYVLKLAPGGEYSGLRVIATDPAGPNALIRRRF